MTSGAAAANVANTHHDAARGRRPADRYTQLSHLIRPARRPASLFLYSGPRLPMEKQLLLSQEAGKDAGRSIAHQSS
jgi:hypothetical protein